MTLDNITLLELMPQFIQQDPSSQALCHALEPAFQALADETKACLIYARVDQLTEPLVDELAWGFNVSFYEGLNLEQKRQMVKKGIFLEAGKGTTAAVEALLNIAFGDAWIEEWFQYGGDPYHFRVLTSNTAVTGDNATRFAAALDSVKNVRSVLEAVIVTLTAELQLYRGCIAHTGDKITIRQVG